METIRNVLKIYNMARVSLLSPVDLQSTGSSTMLAFPEKLWLIVNNPRCEEIQWNDEGTSVIIPSTRKFISEILSNPSSALFKTKNFASFVRQLNLYGFRKISENAQRTSSLPLLVSSKCEFKHPYFRKGKRGKFKKSFYTCVANALSFVESVFTVVRCKGNFYVSLSKYLHI